MRGVPRNLHPEGVPKGAADARTNRPKTEQRSVRRLEMVSARGDELTQTQQRIDKAADDPTRKRRNVTPADLKLIHGYRDQGYSQADVARLTGRHIATIQKHWRDKKKTPEYEIPDPDRLSPEAQKALSDFAYFRQRYFGRVSRPWHSEAANKIVELLATPTKEYLVINCPPGTGKTTLLNDIVCWVLVRDRAKRVLMGSAAENTAADNTNRVMNDLTRPDVYQATDTELAYGVAVDGVATLEGDYGRFKPANGARWTKEKFFIAQHHGRTVQEKEPSVVAFGRDSTFLGGRFNLCIWDDLVSEKNHRGEDSRDKLIRWWNNVAECQPVWAQVSRADGTFTTLGEVKVGDELIGASGLVTVTGTMDNGDKEVFEVRTRHGRRLHVTGNHPLLTPAGWTRADDSLGHGVQAHVAHPTTDQVTEDEALMLGYMAGDGCLTTSRTSIRCELTNIDPALLDNAKRIAFSLGWTVNEKTNSRGVTTLGFGGGARDFFRKHGMAGHSAHTKSVPNTVLASSDRIALAFLTGIIDTDGTIGLGSGRVNHLSVRVVSEPLARGVAELLNRLGVTTTVSTEKKAKLHYAPMWRVSVGKREGWPLLGMTLLNELKAKRLHQWGTELIGPEKFTHDWLPDQIVSITSLGVMPTIGIETSDHTYVTGGILTHNTRIEPGGLHVLCGQRLYPDDLYRYCIDLPAGIEDVTDDGNYPRKYHHIVFPAHDDDNCNELHEIDSPAQGDGGCLLDPFRLPWRELRTIQANPLSDYATVYQQQDGDDKTALVQRVWVDGGVQDMTTYPGCLDRDRDLWQLDGVYDTVQAITIDPSPSQFWAVQCWAYSPRDDLRFLLALERSKMAASQVLDYDIRTRQYRGLLNDWVQTARAIGRPIQRVVVENNAAQKFIAQYTFFRDWASQNNLLIIEHSTVTQNKNSTSFGVQTLGPLWMHGKVRLPYATHSAKVASNHLIKEVTHWPHLATEDQVMAHWFFEFNLDRISRTNAKVYEIPGHRLRYVGTRTA